MCIYIYIYIRSRGPTPQKLWPERLDTGAEIQSGNPKP